MPPKPVILSMITSVSGALLLVESDDVQQYGVLFEINDRELPNLDREEGCGNGYERDDTFWLFFPTVPRSGPSLYNV